MKSTNQPINQSTNLSLSHSGSALLVVLGMLAFMLFSGLAFSVYMRQARLPTSFLRRTVATRQLAKAALAEAIENIDEAIGNDVHPCVLSKTKDFSFSDDTIYNLWSHRVFSGLGSETQKDPSDPPYTIGNKTVYPDHVDPSETVPTLTLEGLAYLPPNLINEARYYSQRTPTAQWHSFWFDSGLYAYTAIDVSDYFDINRVYANRPRSSGNRVSFAHLFEKINVTGEGENREVEHVDVGSGADKWDQFMDAYRVATGNMPLISMADFNVAWGQKGGFDFGGTSLTSPFDNYLNSGIPYSGGSDEEARYAGLTFVTDGWFPKPQSGKTASGETIYDLATQQPFEQSLLEGAGQKNDRDVMDRLNTFPKFKGVVSLLSGIALWDYLDENDIPLSLALPTVERTPMICGMHADIGKLDVYVKRTDDGPQTLSQTATSKHKKLTTSISLDMTALANDISAKLSGNLLALYPFLDRWSKAKDFSIDGRVAVFFVDDADDGNNFNLHIDDSEDAFFLRNGTDATRADFSGAVLSIPFTAPVVSTEDFKSGNAKDSSGAVVPVKNIGPLRFTTPTATDPLIATIVNEWDVTLDDNGNEVDHIDPNNDGSDILAGDAGVADGAQFFRIKNDDTSLGRHSEVAFLRNGTKKINVNIAIIARVKSSDGSSTFDLVPACSADDKALNNVNQEVRRLYPQRSIFKLPAGSFELSIGQIGGFGSGVRGTGKQVQVGTVELAGKSFLTDDPRYNFTPENWWLKDLASMDENSWNSLQTSAGADKDGDVYMATSDQCWLQSIYELAFLPRVQLEGLTDGSGGMMGDYSPNYDGIVCDGVRRTALECNQFMWRTYNPFGRFGYNDFTKLGDGSIVSGDTGMKVNPYSRSQDILMAAFANSPHDWRAACTNDVPGKDSALESAQENCAVFNKKYAWNDYTTTTDGRLCWDCLTSVADEFSAKVERAGNWETAFANLKWSKSPKKIIDFEEIAFAEETDSPVYMVDKKFLYGFWRDSFAARQQLFLIFVRAEPMMMGGGVSGQVPPQLGARAVALVWRDPTATQNRSSNTGGGRQLANPHRTRVLFYHQFE